ncbi:MAG: hypothetical protein ACQ9ET_05140, partial [Nitrosomonadaceae bacterium]
DLDLFINQAHNEYLEWVFDGGVLALALVVFLLVMYLRQWPQLLIKDKWNQFRFIQVGAGIGISLMLIHSFIDFNLHRPANAIFFAFLLAVFFRRNNQELGRKHHKKRTRVSTRHMTMDESRV